MKLDLIGCDPKQEMAMCTQLFKEQKVLVVVSAATGNKIVLSSTCGARLDMTEGGIDADDLWDEPLDPGMWVWSGRIVYQGYESEDVSYEGEFTPCPEPLSRMAVIGEDVFRCRHCDGRGYLP